MCLLPQRLLEVLGIVSRILSDIDARWVLVGSTASCLNGVEVEPKDIDIIVETNKIYEVDQIFAKHFRAIRRVRYSSSGVYSSHYGIYKANGVKVEVMADLKICNGDKCLETDFETLHHDSKTIRIGETGLKVAPLEWQLVANTLIPGKEERVQKILETLKEKGIDYEVLEKVLHHATPVARQQVKTLIHNI